MLHIFNDNIKQQQQQQIDFYHNQYRLRLSLFCYKKSENTASGSYYILNLSYCLLPCTILLFLDKDEKVFLYFLKCHSGHTFI